jgi:hypothetical protein
MGPAQLACDGRGFPVQWAVLMGSYFLEREQPSLLTRLYHAISPVRLDIVVHFALAIIDSEILLATDLVMSLVFKLCKFKSHASWMA